MLIFLFSCGMHACFRFLCGMHVLDVDCSISLNKGVKEARIWCLIDTYGLKVKKIKLLIYVFF